MQLCQSPASYFYDNFYDCQRDGCCAAERDRDAPRHAVEAHRGAAAARRAVLRRGHSAATTAPRAEPARRSDLDLEDDSAGRAPAAQHAAHVLHISSRETDWPRAP